MALDKRAFQRAWLLVAVAVIYCVAFWLLAIETNTPEPKPEWDMDGRPFVPASSSFADGYPVLPHGAAR